MKHSAMYSQIREKTYTIIFQTNTKAGRLFDLILLGFVLISVLLVMMETVADFNLKYHSYLITLEWIITVFFTIEYLLRIFSIDKPIRYVFSFYGIIDLLAILPMFASLFFTGYNILTVVRALRLLRLFKILNNPQFTSQSLKLKRALIASRGKIVVFIYFVLISTIIIGSIMYLIEGKESGFTSIPMSIYWTIVTLTTVGYGDISPQTPLGQFIASFVMILGYGIIAVPTGIVTAEINKYNKSRETQHQNPCGNCEADIYPSNAKFCPNCGHPIENN
ncbi:ion transporter [Flavobacterium seoulense]|uniref:Ion transporter n=1 Tax=Flavobacterium seoulense TaxID=1492738 RepID=A0A066WST8_9FLAO|nr:ion transporter [Flavobacterium seoulense]KDN54054.1 ion transporter [Flavobacterium seoulense]